MIRRGFLEGILGACIAPAFVRPTSLMPLWLPATEIKLPNWLESGLTAEEFVRQDLVAELIEFLRPKVVLPFTLRIGARHG